MSGAIGLLLYVAVIVLANVVRKSAELKNKQSEVFIENEGEGYTIDLEDMLTEEIFEAEEKEASIVITSSEVIPDVEQVVEKLPEWRRTEKIEDDVSETLMPEQFSWKQAIVLAEIIREPRAKRPWPNR